MTVPKFALYLFGSNKNPTWKHSVTNNDGDNGCSKGDFVFLSCLCAKFSTTFINMSGQSRSNGVRKYTSDDHSHKRLVILFRLSKS